MKVLFVSALLVFSSLISFAQDKRQGELELYQDPLLDEVLERYSRHNRARNGMDGFRIQIFFESGRQARSKAYNAKARFLSAFPGENAYLEYKSPFFKVRVGDFRTRREAQEFYVRVKKYFPNAYITPKETIKLPPLD